MNILRTAQPTELSYNPKTPKDKENDKKNANSDVKEAQPATTVPEDDVWMYMNAQACYQAVVVPPTKPTSKVEGAQLPPDDGANYTPDEYVGENPYEKNPKVEGAQLPPDDGANYTPDEYVGENPYEKNPKVETATINLDENQGPQATRTFTFENLLELGFTQDEINNYFTYNEAREVTRVDNGEKEFMNPFYTFETTTVYGQTITTPEKLIHILRNTATLNYDEEGTNYNPPELNNGNANDNVNNDNNSNPKVSSIKKAELNLDENQGPQATRTFTFENLLELGFTQDEINNYFTYNEAREVTRVDNGEKEILPPHYTFENTVIYDQTIDTIELLLHILRNTKKM